MHFPTRCSTLLLLTVAACDGAKAPRAGQPAEPAAPAQAVSEAAVPDAAAPVNTAEPMPNVSSVPRAINSFTFQLYPKLAHGRDNFAYSPASISLALAMTSGGAKGETLAQMERALGLEGLESEHLHAGYGSLLAAWNRPDPTADTLAVVNRMFGEKSLSFRSEFLALTKASYEAGLQPADFRNDADGARREINAWVEKNTSGKIEELLPAGSVTSQTSLVLANAVYFKGKWKHAFDPKHTSTGPFFLEGEPGAPTEKNTSVQVPLMKQRASLRHVAMDGARMLELPYASGRLAMDIVLPDQGETLAALESRLDAALMAKWVDALAAEQVDVTLPRFQIDAPEPVRLKPHLVALGMSLPFSREADFGGISETPTYIDDVFHQAVVEVNEEGTEAAAATAVTMKVRAMAPPAVQFEANRPFLFFIRDVQSGAILFAGRYAAPPRA